jgi:hypothetical protein
MEGTFLPFERSLYVILAEVIQADIVLSVVFDSQLFFVNKSECQQVLYCTKGPFAFIVIKSHKV